MDACLDWMAWHLHRRLLAALVILLGGNVRVFWADWRRRDGFLELPLGNRTREVSN